MPEPILIPPIEGIRKKLHKGLIDYLDQDLRSLVDSKKIEACQGGLEYLSTRGLRSELIFQAATSPVTRRLVAQFEGLEKCLQQKASDVRASVNQQHLIAEESKTVAEGLKIIRERQQAPRN